MKSLMERLDRLHQTFAGLVLAALLGGLAYGGEQIGLNVILYFVLLLALRAKFWYDDDQYLEDVKDGNLPGGVPFIVGYILGIVSWIIWLFAGFYVKNIELSSLIMIFALVPSTFWIVAAMVKEGAYAEQIPWFFFNVFYGLGFYLLHARSAQWNPFTANLELFTSLIIGFMIIIFFIDLSLTRILEQKRISTTD
jgi:hypothetical protein